MSDFTANFTLEQVEAIEASFALGTNEELDALFVINPTPNKTSELVNDSNFVSDASYVHTDNNYTDAEVLKLSGIQSGAEVNVNADWNAASGDALILNKPNLTASARGAISETVEGLDYTTSTGVLSLTSGYIIPTLVNFNNKVDKETGKGLSTNDFTDAYKSKVDSFEPTGGLTYQGAYDASTGVYPTAPDNGNYWIITVAGTISGTEYNIGDQMIYSTVDGWTKLTTGGAVDSEVVHNTGNETIYGNKTFDDETFFNSQVAIGSNTFDLTNPEFLKVDGGTSSSVNIISGYSDYDDYVQLNIKNSNDGLYASSDFVATADIGQEGANYIDLGINNSNFESAEFDIAGALDGYLLVDSGNLAVGTASPNKDLVFFTGGTLQENKRGTLSDTIFDLDVAINASNLSGTNTGDQDLSALATKTEVQNAKLFAIAMAVAL